MLARRLVLRKKRENRFGGSCTYVQPSSYDAGMRVLADKTKQWAMVFPGIALSTLYSLYTQQKTALRRCCLKSEIKQILRQLSIILQR